MKSIVLMKVMIVLKVDDQNRAIISEWTNYPQPVQKLFVILTGDYYINAQHF